MLTPEQRRDCINRIRRLPSELEALVSKLSEEQLITEFIAGEWNVAQNVHHLADAHMNGFIRLKLMLTEDNPPLKLYKQEYWAERVDSYDAPVQYSIMLLRGLHHRWVVLFESLSEAEWNRTGIHPDRGSITAEDILKIYSAHGEAHLDQITRTLAAGK
ncbi:MAG: putative metal-dependent hydrolase [Anaerolineae bacterium]|nr:putative metal-dependent hydrolase [Anaerolineae bacterium]